MSKALATVVAVALGGIALSPVIYSMQHPAPLKSKSGLIKLDKNASNVQKISYAMGYALGQQVNHEVPPEADKKAFLVGQHDAIDGKEPLYTDEEMKVAFESYMKEMAEQQQMQANAATATAQAPTGYIAEQKAFLVENGKKQGVKTTSSGLQYKVITEGTGKQATLDSVVTVHYEGKTINGNIFDSSHQRGEPAKFPLKNVIAGWTEGLSMMKEGGKVELYIPAELAYGPDEKPGIPANSTLVFQVELLKVE